MPSQLPIDSWYYAQDKKKVGPVPLAQLRRLRAEGMLKPEDMVLQEGTTKWRPLAEVSGVEGGTPRRGGLWKLALGGSVGLGMLALFGCCGLVALLYVSNRSKHLEKPGSVADSTGGSGAARGTNNEEEEPSPKENEDSPPKVDSSRPTGKEKSKTSAEPIADRDIRQPRADVILQLGHLNGFGRGVFSKDRRHILTASDDTVILLGSCHRQTNSCLSPYVTDPGNGHLAERSTDPNVGFSWRYWRYIPLGYCNRQKNREIPDSL